MSHVPDTYPEMLDWVEAEKPWAKLPLELVMDFELTAADIRVYAVVDFRCGKAGQWYGRQSEIAMMANVSERQVRGSVEKLSAKGYLLVRRTGIKTATVLAYAIPARSDRKISSAPTGRTVPLTPEEGFRCNDTELNTDHNTEVPSEPIEQPKVIKARPVKKLTTDAYLALEEKHRSKLRDFDGEIDFWLNHMGFQMARDKPAFLDKKLTEKAEREKGGSHAARQPGNQSASPRLDKLREILDAT